MLTNLLETPKKYKAWLKKAFDSVLRNNLKGERIVFVNAWNEWAEGTYLEPDRRYGYSYLNVTANMIRDFYKGEGIETTIAENNAHFKKSSNAVIVLHLYYYDLVDEILSSFQHAKNIDFLMTLPAHTPKSVVDKIISAVDNVYLHIAIACVYLAVITQTFSDGYAGLVSLPASFLSECLSQYKSFDRCNPFL